MFLGGTSGNEQPGSNQDRDQRPVSHLDESGADPASKIPPGPAFPAGVTIGCRRRPFMVRG